MARHVTATPSICEWRRLGEYLWVGTGPWGPIGTVERGRRYKAVDTTGTLLARCHDLGEAQALLEHLAEAQQVTAEQPRRIRAA
ncbi:hypothetical protein [Amnibacterium sp.]|uniref:hypothetical protein n=1 Tax=Amnibacterium sp. TaxID=1872496 RepID=UPI002639B2F7|nr:hypothetical protein [Amnibacterium sp.]